MSMAERRNVAANRPWADSVAYSRAVQIGATIDVGGTTSTDASGAVLFAGDAYGQTRECLRIIGVALNELSASFEDVTRTRVYLTDIDRWREVAEAHGEVFRDICPASTFVEVSRLLHPDLLVEIEATARLPE